MIQDLVNALPSPEPDTDGLQAIADERKRGQDLLGVQAPGKGKPDSGRYPDPSGGGRRGGDCLRAQGSGIAWRDHHPLRNTRWCGERIARVPAQPAGARNGLGTSGASPQDLGAPRKPRRQTGGRLCTA